MKNIILKSVISWVFFTIWALLCVLAVSATNNWNVSNVNTWQQLSSQLWNDTMNEIKNYIDSNNGNSIKPMFKVSKSSNQTWMNTSIQKITWQEIEFDNTNSFDLANNRFQPNVEWVYDIRCSLYAQNLDNNFIQWYLYLNDEDIASKVYRYHFTTTSFSASSLIYMNGSTDYVDCRARDLADTSWSISSSKPLTRFEWYYIWKLN